MRLCLIAKLTNFWISGFSRRFGEKTKPGLVKKPILSLNDLKKDGDDGDLFHLLRC